MATRTRTKTHTYSANGGVVHRYSGGVQFSDVIMLDKLDYTSTCVDVTGTPRSDHTLSIDKTRCQLERLNGAYPSPVAPARSEFVNWFPSSYSSFWTMGHISASHPVSDASAATQVLALTNPNKYSVNGPVSFIELRDIPKMLKKQGDNIIENAAGGYLSWQFGWKPLISDIKKLLDWHRLVDKKVGEIHALYERGGLHRKRSFGNSTVQDVRLINVYSGFGVTSLDHIVTRITERRKWASVRWKPTALPPKDETEYRRQALRIVYGLELSPSNVWEAIPWSWLVDWFSNVGTYLSQYNNVVPVVASTPCVMEQTTTFGTFRIANPLAGVNGGNANVVYRTSSRKIVPPGLTAGIPFLTGRQLSILGSLAILRLK